MIFKWFDNLFKRSYNESFGDVLIDAVTKSIKDHPESWVVSLSGDIKSQNGIIKVCHKTGALYSNGELQFCPKEKRKELYSILNKAKKKMHKEVSINGIYVKN